MTREEAINILYGMRADNLNLNDLYTKDKYDALGMAIKALEQEPCEDAISRQAVIDGIKKVCFSREQEWVDFRVSQGSYGQRDFIINFIEYLPSVQPKSKTGHCKDCKYFEYDSVAKVNGIPLIVAHEICSRWGDGCKTSEDGYCFLFEPQERSEE
jgi:hypothetical protein